MAFTISKNVYNNKFITNYKGTGVHQISTTAQKIGTTAQKPIEQKTSQVWTNAEVFKHSPSYTKPAGSFVVQDNTKAARILEKALSSQHVRKLYNQAVETNALKGGYWGIKFESNLQFKGYCDFTNRQIILSNDIPEDDALAIFVFELTNCVNQPKFSAVDKSLYQHTIGQDAFAKACEKIEHGGTLKHHEVMSAAIKEKGWSQKLDLYRYMPKDFENGWWHQTKNTPHTNYYRDFWKKFNGLSY
jgi:hypothetical protein